MATKKTNKPKVSDFTKQIATRMDVVSFARLLAQTLGNDRWFTDDVIKKTFKQSGAPANKLAKDTSKATKIPIIKSEDKVMSSLMAIHNLLKNSYEDKLKTLEKENQFKEEHDLEKKKQNDELLEAIEELKGMGNAPTATKLKDENNNPNLLGDMLGVLSDLKSVAGILFKVGRFFLFNPIGIALLGAVSLAALIKLGLDELNNKTPNMKALSPEEAANALKGSDRDIEKLGYTRKQLEDIVKNGKKNAQDILAMPEGPEKEKALLAMGGKSKVEAIAKDEKTYEIPPPAPTGQGMADKVTPKAEYVKNARKNKAAAAEYWDKNFGPYYNEDGTKKTATPASSGEPTAPAPTTTPASGGESTSPAPAPATPMAAPMSGGETSTGQKFNAVNSENLEMKLPQKPSDVGATINNMQKNMSEGASATIPLPGVRNAEPTFQRMILNSLRVV